jgi:hypothetical protein
VGAAREIRQLRLAPAPSVQQPLGALPEAEEHLHLAGRQRGADRYGDDPDKTGLELEYDETWHALTDAGEQMPEQRENEGVTSISEYVDRWLPPAEVVKLYSDPEVLRRDLLDRVNRATVVIVPTTTAWG